MSKVESPAGEKDLKELYEVQPSSTHSDVHQEASKR